MLPPPVIKEFTPISQMAPTLLNSIIKIINGVLMFDYDAQDYNFFLTIKRLTSESQILFEVFKCSVQIGVDELKISECRKHDADRIRAMEIKGNLFVQVNKLQSNREKVEFCTLSRMYCKGGPIDPSWEIEKILVHESVGIVIFKIRGVHVVAMNDFSTNMFTYFFEDLSQVLSVVVQSHVVDGKRRYFLLKAYSNHLTRRDITFNPYIEIKGKELKTNDPIEVKMDDQTAIRLRTLKWDSRKVIDSYHNHPLNIIQMPNGMFRTKIGLKGSNMLFSNDGSGHVVFYFNECQFKFTNLPQNLLFDEQGKVKKFNFERSYLLTEDTIIEVKCDSDSFLLKASCSYQKHKDFGEGVKINPDKISHLRRINGLIHLRMKTNTNVDPHISEYHIFDRSTLEKLNFKNMEKLRLLKSCVAYEIFIVCKEQTPKEIHSRNGELMYLANTLKWFRFKKSTLEELPHMSEKFLEIVKQEIYEKEIVLDKLELNVVPIIKIKQFSVDRITPDVLYVFFKIDLSGPFKIVTLKLDNISFETDNLSDLKINSRIYQLEQGDSVSKNLKAFSFDSVLTIFSSSPKFHLVSYNNQCLNTFDFIDTFSIERLSFYLDCGILLIVYKHHENHRYHYALFYVVADTIKQLIRNEELDNFNSKTGRVTLTMLSDMVALILIFDSESGHIFKSYMHFLDGPFYVASDINRQIVVDKQQFLLNLQPDFKFNENTIKYKEGPLVYLDKTQNSKSIDLERYVSFFGHVKDINIIGQFAGKKEINFVKPLFRKEDTVIEFIDKKAFVFYPNPDWITYSFLQKSKRIYYFYSLDDIYDRTKVDFRLPNDKECYSVSRVNDLLFCFWYDKGNTFITIMRESMTNVFFVYSTPLRASNIKIFHVTNTKVFISFMDSAKRKVSIYRLEIPSWVSEINPDEVTTIDGKFDYFHISAQDLLTDFLKVAKYDIYANEKTGMLYLLVLDNLRNCLYLYKASLESLEEFSTLKNSIDLNPIDQSFYTFSCEFNQETILFDCYLLSDKFIFKTRISLSLNTYLSEFKWVFEVTDKSYNCLYESSIFDRFSPSIKSFGNLVLIMDNKKQPKQKDLVYFYDFSSENKKHSSFSFDLSSLGTLVGIHFAKKTNEVHLFYCYQNRFRRLVLSLNRYTIKLKNFNKKTNEDRELSLEDNQSDQSENVWFTSEIEIEVEFLNRNKYSVGLRLKKINEKEGHDENVKQRLSMTMLIIIIVVSVLILSLTLSLVILMEKQKKLNKKLNFLENAPGDSESVLSRFYEQESKG